MKQFLIAAALCALSLTTGCAQMLDPARPIPAAPAPLASTTIDDQGLKAAWEAFDVALDAINLLGDVGAIEPGSPRGRAVAGGIRTVSAALVAAERFAAAGSTTSYETALREAATGMVALRAILKGQ